MNRTWIVLGAVAVIGVAIGIVVTSGSRHDAPIDVARSTAAARVVEPCPAGQARSVATLDRCCWPEQTWSTTTARCTGRPRCPIGMTIDDGEICVPMALHTSVKPDAVAPPFTLNAATLAPGTELVVTFDAPVRSEGTRRAWLTIVLADAPPDSYRVWSFVPHRARIVRLTAPPDIGAYEVRLHTDYPDQLHNLRAAVPFVVSDGRAEVESTPLEEQRFTVDKATIRAQAKVVLEFPTALHAEAGERFWVTIVHPGAAETAWTDYEYVPYGAKSVRLVMPAMPGPYEIRLHAKYPTRMFNVVHRVAIDVP